MVSNCLFHKVFLTKSAKLNYLCIEHYTFSDNVIPFQIVHRRFAKGRGKKRYGRNVFSCSGVAFLTVKLLKVGERWFL